MAGKVLETMRAGRAPSIIVPAAVLGGVLAAAFALFGDMRGNAGEYDQIPAGSIEAIEFVARSGKAVEPALVAACARTGCIAGDLHPMITASASAMTETELREALRAQGLLILESHAAHLAAPAGSEERQVSELEIDAALRLAELYRAELHTR